MKVDLALGLLIGATAVAGMGLAATLDQHIKQLPTRHQIGVVAYSTYSRVADCHYGFFWYVPLGIAWAGVVVAAAVVGLLDDPAGQRLAALWTMVGGVVIHAVVTGARAAPIMMSQREVNEQDEAALTGLFNRFSRWSIVRGVGDAVTLGGAVWALLETIAEG